MLRNSGRARSPRVSPGDLLPERHPASRSPSSHTTDETVIDIEQESEVDFSDAFDVLFSFEEGEEVEQPHRKTKANKPIVSKSDVVHSRRRRSSVVTLKDGIMDHLEGIANPAAELAEEGSSDKSLYQVRVFYMFSYFFWVSFYKAKTCPSYYCRTAQEV